MNCARYTMRGRIKIFQSISINENAAHGNICDGVICFPSRRTSSSNANNSGKNAKSRLRRHGTAMLAVAAKRAAPMQNALETLSAVDVVVKYRVDVKTR